MSRYPSNLRRVDERSSADKPLGQIRDRIIAAAERALRRLLNPEAPLVPVPIRTDADRRRRDQGPSRD